MLRKYACLAAALMVCSGAQAGNINWGTATNIVATTDVVITGSPFLANDFGPSGVSGTTLNGAVFSPFAVTAALNSYTTGNLTLSASSVIGGALLNTFGSASAPFASLPAAYRTMLGNSAYVTNNPLTVTLNGLNTGQNYEIQFWVNDSRGNVGPTRTEVLNSGGNIVTLAFNTGGEGGLGQYVTGTFVAGASSQSFTVTGFDTTFPAQPNRASQINGLQVLSIATLGATPAPPSVILGLTGLVLAGLYFAWMGRRNSGRI